MNRERRRAEKKRQWRHENQLWHEEKTLTGTVRILTNRKHRRGESKISRWHRRRKKVAP